MALYIKQGDTIIPTSESQFMNEIPVGTYTVGLDEYKGFYLQRIDDFDVNMKIYGKSNAWSDRILNTFESRPNTTGVWLDGEKGSGKTLLTKLIAKNGADRGYPTIVINNAFGGDQFNSFIQMIEQPAIVIFDEFEKVYNDDDQQNRILTLLDGVYPSKKLFMITTNNGYRVSDHMRNRPGRIFYYIEYSGVDNEFIREYCTDNLKDVTQTESVIRVSSVFQKFNFDMLKALIEEMNRYGESAIEAIELLNAKPLGKESGSQYTCDTYFNGVKITSGIRINAYGGAHVTNPLLNAINMIEIVNYIYDDPDAPIAEVAGENMNAKIMNKIKSRQDMSLIKNEDGATMSSDDLFKLIGAKTIGTNGDKIRMSEEVVRFGIGVGDLVSVTNDGSTIHYRVTEDEVTFDLIFNKVVQTQYDWRMAMAF